MERRAHAPLSDASAAGAGRVRRVEGGVTRGSVGRGALSFSPQHPASFASDLNLCIPRLPSLEQEMCYRMDCSLHDECQPRRSCKSIPHQQSIRSPPAESTRCGARARRSDRQHEGRLKLRPLARLKFTFPFSPQRTPFHTWSKTTTACSGSSSTRPPKRTRRRRPPRPSPSWRTPIRPTFLSLLTRHTPPLARQTSSRSASLHQ